MSDTTIPMLPQVIGLTGAEQFEVVQAGQSKRTTLSQIAEFTGGGSPTPPPPTPGTVALGMQNLSIKTANFADTVAKATLVANYQFGSSVTPAPGIIPITNITDLTNNFNPFEAFTNLTTINSEIERYQPFNTGNHVFNATNLTLQGLNPNNDWQVTAVTQCSGFASGVATAIAALGLANTSSVTVGQMASVQGGGIGGMYYVTAIVANTTVTLTALNGAPGTQNSIGLIFWLPVYGGSLSAPTVVGSNTLTFSAVPSPWQIGQMIGWYNHPAGGITLQRDEDYRITNIAGNTVTFDPVLGPVGNMGANQLIWAFPVVTSGQIWSQLNLDLSNPQTFMAIEADLDLFPTWGPIRTNTLGPSGQWTLASFNALPATTPLGGWPAFWMYSADDGNSAAETGSAAEIDMMELQICGTQDCTDMNTGAVTYTGAARIMQKNDSGWSTALGFGISSKTDGTTFVGRNLYQYILTNGMEYRFFNGVLYKVQELMWTAQRPAQFSVGLALGALNFAAAQNTIFPNNPTSFPLMQVAINGVRVWYNAP